jgi:hypothetical protein
MTGLMWITVYLPLRDAATRDFCLSVTPLMGGGQQRLEENRFPFSD